METVEIKLFKTPEALLIDVGLTAFVTVYVIGSATLDYVLAGSSVEGLEIIAEKIQNSL